MADPLVDLIDERVQPYYPRKAKPKATGEAGQDAPRPGRPPVCYGYCRVSLDRQAKGTSLASQAEAIRAVHAQRFAATHPRFELFEEAESAAALKFGDRPKGKELLARLGPGDVLIVAKLDRFARRLIEGLTELRDLCRTGVRVLCLDLGPEPIAFDGGAGEIVLTLMLWVAQYERKRIIERCVEGQRRARAERKGTPREWKGNCRRYGEKYVDGKKVPDPEHRRYVQTLMACYEFCRRRLKHSKCDKRNDMVFERYKLYWYHDYFKSGTTRPKTKVPRPNQYLAWFKRELRAQAEDRAADRPPPLPVDEPWVRDYDAGTFEVIPPLDFLPFPIKGNPNTA